MAHDFTLQHIWKQPNLEEEQTISMYQVGSLCKLI